MARVFLSPSQTVNTQQMSMITDAIEPLLQTNGIEYARVRQGAPVAEAIASANAGNFDVYLGIHSNSSSVPGAAFGNRNYFWETSQNGRRLAQDIADEFSLIYYDPSRTTIVPNRTQEELRRTRMPAVNVFTAFHDNQKDERWIQTNIQNIAQAIVRALARYFGITYIGPCMDGEDNAAGQTFTGFRWARVCDLDTALNIRNAPNGDVLFTLPRGSQVIVTGQEKDGFTPVRFDSWNGWAASQFICICRISKAPVRPPVIPPIMPPLPQFKIGRVQTHGSNLNLRDAPSLQGNIIAQMPNNSHLLILQTVGDWYYVFWNGQLGFASKDWITTQA